MEELVETDLRGLLRDHLVQQHRAALRIAAQGNGPLPWPTMPGGATGSVQSGRCRTSSRTNLLPKNAITSSAIAANVQRTAVAPRQP